MEYDDEKNDVYDRKLGYLFLDDEFINEKLLKEGMAKLYTKTTNQKYSERLKKQNNTQKIIRRDSGKISMLMIQIYIKIYRF